MALVALVGISLIGVPLLARSPASPLVTSRLSDLLIAKSDTPDQHESHGPTQQDATIRNRHYKQSPGGVHNLLIPLEPARRVELLTC